VGYKDVSDEFWVRGHMPGSMPGVVMLESIAQLCSFVSRV
jgi:3-hydroxymyristoyl/3-hydroxydecanoyl-(acyl carrier protein) dehydratase